MRMLLVLAVGILSACQSASDAEPSQVEVAESAQDDLSVASPPAERPLEIADPARATSGSAARDTPAPAPRVLIRTADLRLRVRDYDDARRAVAATARRMGAFVAGEAEQRLPYEVTNTLTLRVEAARFDTLMEALAALGEEVVERRVSVDDVTEQAVDLESRLRARRAVEARFVEVALPDERDGVGQILFDVFIGSGRAVVPDDLAQRFKSRPVGVAKNLRQRARVGIAKN